MPINLIEEAGGKLISVTVSGKLTKHDYEHFSPEVERLIKQYGKIDILLTMHDFHGWDGGALWGDIKFDLKHFSDIRRLAFVGETKWEKWMAAFCTPFTTAQIKYFDQRQAEQARAWILGPAAHSGAPTAPKPAADLHAKHAVFGIYVNRTAAEKAVEQLKKDGFRTDEISIFIPHLKVFRLIPPSENAAVEDSLLGFMAGSSLAGITLIAIPRFGAAFVGGPIAWAYLSLAALSSAGGIIGGFLGLLKLGLPDVQIKHYENRLHKGDTLLSVHCDDKTRTMKAKEVLIHTGAEDVYARASLTK